MALSARQRLYDRIREYTNSQKRITSNRWILLVRAEVSSSNFKMTLSFALISSTGDIRAKFINNVRTEENTNFIFECEKIN